MTNRPAPFRRVLVANRGEIALRVIRACQELNVSTVVAHSTEDRDSAPVRAADAAVCVGPAATRDSYLNAPAIVEAALRHGADAVHPGYGFLSEDADFAEICTTNGLVFIGPPPDVLAMVGDKARARSLMGDAGLPVMPGSEGAVAGDDDVERVAGEIGFPVIVKAAAGGGGLGMQVALDRDDLVRKVRETRAYAQVTFGDGSVYLERYLRDVRHVEVQILCDVTGNAVSLGERDCSVQRRRQKLIEESPAPNLPAPLLDAVNEAARAGARAVGYVGAGTFEFLVDRAGRFYFLEINARLQVEHGVTEMVTGVDIVQEQIRVAAGQPLSAAALAARDQRRGVSIECRVNAENAARGFMPAPGLLHRFRPPGGPFVRVDTHGFEGYRVPASYDSLLAKVIVWGPDRSAAIARMRRALGEFEIEGPGVHTTVETLRDLLADPTFAAAGHTTAMLDDRPAQPVGS